MDIGLHHPILYFVGSCIISFIGGVVVASLFVSGPEPNRRFYDKDALDRKLRDVLLRKR